MENVLHPVVIGRGNHIHPLLLLLHVLGGISFFGPIGLFLGPLVFSLSLTLFEIYPTLIRIGRKLSYGESFFIAGKIPRVARNDSELYLCVRLPIFYHWVNLSGQ